MALISDIPTEATTLASTVLFEIEDGGLSKYTSMATLTTYISGVVTWDTLTGTPFTTVGGIESIANMHVDSGKITINSADDPFLLLYGSASGVGVSLEAVGTGVFQRSGDVSLYSGRLGSDGNTAVFARDGAIVGSISVTTTATAYNTTSDRRLKENIESVDPDDALSLVDSLPVRNFNFIADTSNVVTDFIADELQHYIPNAVTGAPDAIDLQGNPVYQMVDKSKIIPYLVASIQALKARIEQLESN